MVSRNRSCYGTKGCFACGRTGVFRATGRGDVSRFRPRPTFAHGGKSLLRCPKFLRCLTAAGVFLFFCLRRPHFFQQRKKWGKERRQKLRFCISSRAMSIADLILRSTRSRRSSHIAPSKDCLCNSAAAADWFDEQRFWFYRCNSERQRRRREVSSSYGTTWDMFCERVVHGIKIRKV